MDKVKARGLFSSCVFNVFDSPVFRLILVLLVFSVLIFFQPARNAYSQAGFDCENAVSNPIQNCGFEEGDFSGWVTQDLSTPFFALRVGGAGLSPGNGLFTSDPPQGVFAALTGFDGNGPGTIRVAQDVVLPPNAHTLFFEYQCGWDLNFGATLNRTFEVNIEPSGGGTPLRTDIILTALAGTSELPDAGDNQFGHVNLSSFRGQAVRISFDWVVPQDFSGPAFCQLDNIAVNPSNPIPTLSEWGMIFTAGMLGILALIVLRRRQASLS